MHVVAQTDAIKVRFRHIGAHPEIVGIDNGGDRLADVHDFTLTGGQHGDDPGNGGVNLRIVQANLRL